MCRENILDLLKRTTRSLRIKDPNKHHRRPIERDKAIEIIGTDVCQCDRRAPREDKANTPVRGSRHRRAARSDGRGEDLTLVDPGYHTKSREKEREDEEHGDGSSQSMWVGVGVVEIDVQRERGFNAQGYSHTEKRLDEQFPAPDFVDEKHEDRVPELRQRAPKSDYH